MQTQAINAVNSQNFGAKLRIDDTFGVLRGFAKGNSAEKNVQSFSSEDLRAIKKAFKELTKDEKGDLLIKTDSFDSIDLDRSSLNYKDNRYSDKLTVSFLQDMPKSVEDFTNRLVKIFNAFKLKQERVQEITKLENQLSILKTRTIKDMNGIAKGQFATPKDAGEFYIDL